MVSGTTARYKSERDAYCTRCRELEAKVLSLEEKQRKLEEEAWNNENFTRKKEMEVARLEEESKKLQSRERDRSNELKTAKDDLAMAELQHEETKRLTRMKETEVGRLEERLKELQTRERDSVTELEAARDDLVVAELHHEETKRLSQMREKEVARLEEELKKIQSRERDKDIELMAIRHDLVVAESQHEETKRLLKTKFGQRVIRKEDELDGMQASTRKADQLSVGDVIGLVKALNAKTLQVAALISDPYHLPFPEDQVSDQDMANAVEAVRNSLGVGIAQAVQILRDLRRESHPEDPTATQLTLQITLTAFSEKMINTWIPNRQWDINEWLINTSERIRATETQAIAGRWRALTRGQTDVTDSNFIMERLMDQLVLVLIGIGYQVQADVFREAFQNHLTDIVDKIVRIQTAVGESVTSVDIMPYCCAPGEDFKTDYMDDTYGFSGTDEPGKDATVGTTELGLWQKEKKTDAAGRMDDQYVPLLKAKVVLESALRE